MFRTTCLAAVLLMLPVAHASAQFGFNLYNSGVDVSGEDLDILGASVRTVLDSGTVGETDDWSNPATGMHGETTLLEVYEDDDTQCGRVRILVEQEDREAPFELRMCQRPDGTWGIAG